MKSTKRTRILIGVIGSIVACSCAINLATRVGGAKIPKPQFISSTENICIAFRGTMGSGENVVMFTYRCDTLIKDVNYVKNIYEQKQYLDEVRTMECPIIRLEDNDNDGFKEVYVTQDEICKEFAHPWHEDSQELFFIVNKAGEFIETDIAN